MMLWIGTTGDRLITLDKQGAWLLKAFWLTTQESLQYQVALIKDWPPGFEGNQ